MKKKSLMIIVSVLLNLVLFAALVYCNKINGRTEGATAPLFVIQHLSGLNHLQIDGQGVTVASTMN